MTGNTDEWSVSDASGFTFTRDRVFYLGFSYTREQSDLMRCSLCSRSDYPSLYSCGCTMMIARRLKHVAEVISSDATLRILARPCESLILCVPACYILAGEPVISSDVT